MRLRVAYYCRVGKVYKMAVLNTRGPRGIRVADRLDAGVQEQLPDPRRCHARAVTRLAV
ncbi:MAG: hypothetical protein PVJ40_10280 [Gammaproteobacteria bacterium]|jgi:hypothetical protein